MRNYAGSALMLFVTITAAIGSYTVNLKVSSERSAVEKLRRSIVADARDMRDLQAELRTRARLPEMQRWNDNVLMMSAPAAGQYLRSPVQLASFGAVPDAAPAIVPAEPALRYAVTTPVPVPQAGQVVRAAYDAAAPRAATAPAVPAAAGTGTARAAVARPAIVRAPDVRAPEMARIIRASYPAARAADQAPRPLPADVAVPVANAPIDLMPEGGQ